MAPRTPDRALEFCFQALPAEIIKSILSYLSPEDVTAVSASSKLLRTHALDDFIWQTFLREALPNQELPSPRLGSYRDLYLAHHPHWFLVRHRVWYNDQVPHGGIIFVKYDHNRGCIEGYSIAAARHPHEHGMVEWEGRQVLYDTFNPRVHLDLNQARLRLDSKAFKTSNQFNPESLMEVGPTSPHHIKFSTVFLHTRSLDLDTAAEPSVQVWPPRLLPGMERVRNTSSNSFRSTDHVPRSTRQVCDTAFRVRARMESHFLPMAPLHLFGQRKNQEVVHTYSTLPREAYTPTAEKPWQGIWCGDYHGHGTEFLAIMQPDSPLPLPEKAAMAFDTWPDINEEDMNTLLYGQNEDDDFEGVADNLGQNYATIASMVGDGSANSSQLWAWVEKSELAPYRGRLEAVKLTGDPNIPRGEFTFIAQDLGERGLINHTKDPIFTDSVTKATEKDKPSDDKHDEPKRPTSRLPNRMTEGARVVKSVGHVAGHGFTGDSYIPTQLVLVSENTLAQYWKPFKHISYYKRVDLDALTKT